MSMHHTYDHSVSFLTNLNDIISSHRLGAIRRSSFSKYPLTLIVGPDEMQQVRAAVYKPVGMDSTGAIQAEKTLTMFKIVEKPGGPWFEILSADEVSTNA